MAKEGLRTEESPVTIKKHVFWKCLLLFPSCVATKQGERIWLDTPTCVLDPRVASDTRQGYLTPQILQLLPPPLLQDLFL